MLVRFKLYLLIICCSLLGFTSQGQQPAYFILGESQFKGVQVYDVVQDHDLNYWFATNEGLYFFNHYTYEKIECDKAKSNSVFNFVINKNGIIYCHNLNNQVFQIRNKSCTLFYEIENDESNSDVYLSITETNELVIGSRKLIVLNEQGTVLNRFAVGQHYLGPPYNTQQGIIYHLGATDSVLVLKNKQTSRRRLSSANDLGIENDVLKFFTHQEKSYALNLHSKALFAFEAETFALSALSKNAIFERSESVRLYSTDNELWVAGTLPGVVMLNEAFSSLKRNLLYDGYFISDVYKDHEGNLLLSTFDKGILVIPDMEIPDVINSFRDDPVTSLFFDTEIGLLLGSSKGQLMSYRNEAFVTLNDKGKRPIERLYGQTNFPFILFDDGYIRAYNKQNKTISDVYHASLKDAVIASDKLFYLGTNIGIVKCEWAGGSKFHCVVMKDFNFRVYSMALNPETGVLYAATSNGLFYIKADGHGEKIIYNKEAFYPNTLYYNKGKIYATDKKGGILIIEGDHVRASIFPVVNGQTEQLSKFIIHNNTLIAKSPKGLFQFDMSGKLLNALSISQGLSSNRIIDIALEGDQLWVSHTNGVQQINLNTLRQKSTSPEIRLAGIFVNDYAIDSTNNGELKTNQRKIEFVIASPTLRNRENISYHYKLEGNDSRWTVNDYESNKITYNALAPGTYTFFVKAEKQGMFSETIAYTFNIAAPFYAHWWFIALALLLFLIVVYSIYRWQLNIQRKKSQQINELNASKLTAIQSQMNPHFIFNSLNSIQDLILKGDVENSYSYITTFSNLVRRTLSYSDKDFIDFEQEIKLIELYLSLEKLRFKKDLNYTINTNNIGDIQIPPMLIQPFIENALVHGLLHKEGTKQLSISFHLNDVLTCTIEDNGVGREKSKAIKQRQRADHESFAGKAIDKRFEILSNIFGGDFGIVYEDLQENNEATGTKVILRMPVKHRF